MFHHNPPVPLDVIALHCKSVIYVPSPLSPLKCECTKWNQCHLCSIITSLRCHRAKWYQCYLCYTNYCHLCSIIYVTMSQCKCHLCSRVPTDFHRKKYMIIGQFFDGILDILAQLQDTTDLVFGIPIHIIDQYNRQEYILLFRKL